MTEDKLNKSMSLLKHINFLKRYESRTREYNELNNSYNKAGKYFIIPTLEEDDSDMFKLSEDAENQYFDDEWLDNFNNQIKKEFSLFLQKANILYKEEIEKLQKEFDKI